MRHVRPASIVHHHIAVDRIATTVAQLDGLRHAARQGVEVEDTARCWSGPHMVHGPLYLGHALLRMGDIDRARRHFGLCFDTGLPEAALALAGTYDPGILGKANRHHADAESCRAVVPAMAPALGRARCHIAGDQSSSTDRYPDAGLNRLHQGQLVQTHLMVQIGSSGKARCAAQCRTSGKRRNAVGGPMWPTEVRVFRLSGQRCASLMMPGITALRAPCRKAGKRGEIGRYWLPLVLPTSRLTKPAAWPSLRVLEFDLCGRAAWTSRLSCFASWAAYSRYSSTAAGATTWWRSRPLSWHCCWAPCRQRRRFPDSATRPP